MPGPPTNQDCQNAWSESGGMSRPHSEGPIVTKNGGVDVTIGRTRMHKEPTTPLRAGSPLRVTPGLDRTITIQRRSGDEECGVLAAVLEGVSDAVVVVERSGCVLRSNPTYDRLLRSSGGAISFQKQDGSALAPDAMPLSLAARAESAEHELTMVDQAGGRHRYRVVVRPILTPGLRGEAGVVTFHDLGVVPSHALEERFVALLGHELRAPVSGLHSYAELLIDYLDDLGGVEARTAARRIHSFSDRLSRMIQDLYELARMSSGQLQLRQEPFDPRTLVTSSVEIAEALPDAPPIHVDGLEVDVMLRGDILRLGGVMLNLLTNAIKHAPGTNSIDVRIRLQDQGVAIDVEDCGPGIPPSVLPLIFSKYYQVSREDEEDAHTGDGLGLGLFIAQQVVSAHGGRISVASELGRGTCFTVYLPNTSTLITTRTTDPLVATHLSS
jgi:signal transduction histidine kinase